MAACGVICEPVYNGHVKALRHNCQGVERRVGHVSAAPIELLDGIHLLAVSVVHTYWAALGLGGTVLIGSLLMGGLGGDADGDVDAAADSGHDVGHDSSHHDSGARSAPGILSPMMLAFFLVCFALVGLMLTEWQSHWGSASLGPAIGAGIAVSLVLRKAVGIIYAGADGGNEPRPGDEIGLEAEVLSAISAKGLGTIAYIVRGMRYTRAARSATQHEFRTGDRVVITRSDKNVCTVAPCSDQSRS